MDADSSPVVVLRKMNASVAGATPRLAAAICANSTANLLL
jgi:hypothetical protein